jgi:predicted ArsR family transcriptional regulator
MHTTKSEILARLKRFDGATVDDLAGSLGLAPMTIRQHLTALERDDLIRAKAVRRTTGRPHYRYELTDEGHRQIAQGYDRLVELLVDAAGSLEPQEMAGLDADARRALLFRIAASALAVRCRNDVVSLPAAERGERIAEILRAYGGFSDAHVAGDAVELRDFNCVYRGAMADGAVNGSCEWHETLLSELFGATPLAVEPSDDCPACCRYVIRPSMPTTIEPTTETRSRA